MAEINPSLSVITLNVNGWNKAIKKERLAGWISKEKPNKQCLYAVYKRLNLNIRSQSS